MRDDEAILYFQGLIKTRLLRPPQADEAMTLLPTFYEIIKH